MLAALEPLSIPAPSPTHSAFWRRYGRAELSDRTGEWARGSRMTRACGSRTAQARDGERAQVKDSVAVWLEDGGVARVKGGAEVHGEGDVWLLGVALSISALVEKWGKRGHWCRVNLNGLGQGEKRSEAVKDFFDHYFNPFGYIPIHKEHRVLFDQDTATHGLTQSEYDKWFNSYRGCERTPVCKCHVKLYVRPSHDHRPGQPGGYSEVFLFLMCKMAMREVCALKKMKRRTLFKQPLLALATLLLALPTLSTWTRIVTPDLDKLVPFLPDAGMDYGASLQTFREGIPFWRMWVFLLAALSLVPTDTLPADSDVSSVVDLGATTAQLTPAIESVADTSASLSTLGTGSCPTKLPAFTRAHKTTVTCTPHPLGIVVLSRMIHEADLGPGVKARKIKYKTIPSAIPISLRSQIVPKDVAAAPVSPTSFPWARATKLGADPKRVSPKAAKDTGPTKYDLISSLSLRVLPDPTPCGPKVRHAPVERDALTATKTLWLMRLLPHAFQNHQRVYVTMEYVPGDPAH
ncbi:uncharacterized protein BXZ73DRAFT_109312 [Epithele typhae]|uniref:uncharacterized protein n=1 Tax=Epithele typhae TaxID=378194 RepID=UPI0020080589|nr:uncharacterized protein BXZ73DRAFT_109312 [Epithele typhae]KAH9910232.1 hypothetical protein BXZ73DRAFT_109312 [Epithele typhae]